MFNISQIVLGIILAVTFLVFAISFALKRKGWTVISLFIMGLYVFGNIATSLL